MKLPVEFTWYRKYRDGRVEFEFDPQTGAATMWGKEAPDGLIEFGWMPMTISLARLIAAYGEVGVPNDCQLVSVKLRPGEIPVIYRDRQSAKGALVECKCCQGVFRTTKPPVKCPFCEVTPESGDPDPFKKQQAAWEEATYVIGISGRFTQTFNRAGMVTE
jgi:hypothetical protein